MACRQLKAKERLSQPQGRFRTGISLHQGGKLAIKSKGGDALIKEIVSGQKLQKGAGGNPPCPSRVSRRIRQKEIGTQGAGGAISVDTASSPHIGITIPVKKVRISLHQLIGAFLKAFCQIRFVFIPIPIIPDRRIKIKCPAGIIVKALPIPVPAVPYSVI